MKNNLIYFMAGVVLGSAIDAAIWGALHLTPGAKHWIDIFSVLIGFLLILFKAKIPTGFQKIAEHTAVAAPGMIILVDFFK